MSKVLSEKTIEGDAAFGGSHSPAYPFVTRVPTLPHNWDLLIESQGASLLQSWGWGEFKHSSAWSPYRLALHRKGEQKPGTADHHKDATKPSIYGQVLYRSDSRLPFRLSIAYAPRGPVVFPQAANDGVAERAFWRSVHAESRKRGAIFLKVEPDIALDGTITKSVVDHKMATLGFRPSGRLQPARTWVLDIGGKEDDLLKGMKPKTRYNLRLAGRRGVVVRRAESYNDLRAFHSLLETTGTRDEFGIHTFPYYDSLWRTFGPNGLNTMALLIADHPDEAERAQGPIAGLLAMRFGTDAVYMYGASDNRGREHMPNYLLQWEAMKWAKANGCTRYDFWGIPDPPSEGEEENSEVSPINTRSGLRGVYWFKRGFGGREIEYPGAYDYVYNHLLYKIWMRWRGNNLG
ncbi:MAG: peptidoglycan bridge formation glycyltransferase FemA/FemB family protein [Chloroflexia bacterium]